MKRPADLFDRDQEWLDLGQFCQSPGRGIKLGLVRGRRRQGKSYLLRRLASSTGGFYHQAVEQEPAPALESFGAALSAHLGAPGRFALANWDEAINALTQLPAQGGPPLAIIDEFPYLLRQSPELPSIIQRTIDRSRDDGAPLRLVLCGSALSTMADLLTGAKALRGRAALDIVVNAFDYRTAATYWELDDPHSAFLVDAVVGGTPGYRDLLSARPLQRSGDLARWLATGPLNPASAMFREDEYLLAEEPSITDRGLYHSVVSAIAGGNTTQGRIAAALGREARAVQHPLKALEEAGFITRTDDALRTRRPIYRLRDPIVRFHHVVTRRDLARFEDRRTDEAWADALPRFRSHVLGPHFEELAREFTRRFAASKTIGGRSSRVAPAVINDAADRSQHEIDVVAMAQDADGSQRVLALGEAKHTTTKRQPADLKRLDHVRALVAEREPSAADAKLLLFSAGGFGKQLTSQASERDDVELIDIERLYQGE